jgi:heptaprenyl diphosphate synthase
MTRNNGLSTKQIALRGMLVALAMVLSWFESRVSLGIMIPGMKLGLTNLVVMIALYRLSEKDAIFINIIRILLVSMTFGNMFSMVYSLAGGLLSGTVMIILKRTKKFSMTSVSVAGGIFHNVGQIVVAMILMQTLALFYYLMVLWISGIVSGIIIGILSAEMVKRIPVNIM